MTFSTLPSTINISDFFLPSIHHYYKVRSLKVHVETFYAAGQNIFFLCTVQKSQLPLKIAFVLFFNIFPKVCKKIEQLHT